MTSTFGSFKLKILLNWAFSLCKNFSIEILYSSLIEIELMCTSTLLRVFIIYHPSFLSIQINSHLLTLLLYLLSTFEKDKV
jgi:hypothetical protein